jgi:hypothetical protein
LAGVQHVGTAALSFDFLFIPPYGTFTIGRPEGWLLLFLFIATATLVVGRIQSILREEQDRERKATFLYELVAAMANQTTREAIAEVVANQIQQKFIAEDVGIYLQGGWGYQPFTIRAVKRQKFISNRKPDRVFTIVSGSILIGEIDIGQGLSSLPPESDLMLQTMLSQISAALERARLAEGKPPLPERKPSYDDGNSLPASQP